MAQRPALKPNLVDKAIALVSPRLALDRLRFRAAYTYVTGNDNAGYIVGGSSRRSMRGWTPAANDAKTDIVPKLSAARASSRDLYMNTPIATAALRRIRTNAVGPGLTLQCRIDRDALGLTDDQADAWERKTQREFHMWARSIESDATRQTNFYGLQQLAFLSMLMNGDVFALLPYLDRPKTRLSMPYRLAVKLVEADQIDTPFHRLNDKNVVAGVETDAAGAVVAYHMRKTMDTLLPTGPENWERISAYGDQSGRRNVLHLLKRERVGQLRGMPMLAPVFEPLKQIARLSEAELTAAIINAFFTVFVKNVPGALGSGYAQAESLLSSSVDDGTSGRSASHPDNNLYEIGSGNIVELEDGQDITLADSKRPNAMFEPFFNAIVRQVGASCEVPYEQLMLAFTASYSASRAALLEAWKFYRGERRLISDGLCAPVYEEWLTEAVLIGRIQAPGFVDDWALREAWVGSTWVGPSQGQLNPDVETKAAQARIEANLSTYDTEYSAIHGDDWEAGMDRKAREQRFLRSRGLNATEKEGDNNDQPAPRPNSPDGGDGDTETPDDTQQPDEGQA